MKVIDILHRVTQAGGRLIPNAAGDKLVMKAPEPLPDELRAAVREYKTALLTLLQTPASEAPEKPGTVGRHGDPCPACGDTWQWPTTRGTWICSWCFVQGRRVVRGRNGSQ